MLRLLACSSIELSSMLVLWILDLQTSRACLHVSSCLHT